jgi:hypothetical protein
MPQAPGKDQFRANIPTWINVLVRAVMPHLNTGKDWNLGDVTEAALLLWLRQPEQADLISRYNLLQALESRGLLTPEIQRKLVSLDANKKEAAD